MEGKTFLLHKRSHLDETLVPVGCCQGLDEIVGAVFGEGINQAALPVKREIFIVNAIFLGVGDAEAQQVSQTVLFADVQALPDLRIGFLQPDDPLPRIYVWTWKSAIAGAHLLEHGLRRFERHEVGLGHLRSSWRCKGGKRKENE